MRVRMNWALIRVVPMAALGILLASCVARTTGPTEVGVRTVKFGLYMKKGVEDKIYPPGGTYFFVPLINDWNTFDIRLHNMEMTISTLRGDRMVRDDLLFKTIDGNDISLDVIISYRIDPKKAPFILQHVAPNDEELKDNIVRTVARSRPRDIFGELRSEEFYVSEKRGEKAERARDELNRILNPYGIIVEKVATKDYRFNEEYQKAIEARKIADQMAEKNKAEARAAREEYLAKLEEAQGEVNKMVASVDGEFQKAKIEADAYYDKQKRIAQAVEIEGKAQAEGIRKLNEALSGPGGEVMVKLQLAEAMKGKRIMLLPISGGGLDLRTTDVNRLLEVYGLRSLQSQQAPSTTK
jgi:regulator of protease activity HflC (stomatin/prohibitin superfamily)